MKRLLLTVVVLAAALTAGVASAQVTQQDGVKLAFDDCGGASSATWTCAANAGNAFTAVASVQIATAVTTITGEESSMEVVFQSAVPEWWKAGTGLCRAVSAINAAFSPVLGGASCIDYFGQVGPSGGFFTTVGPGSDPLDAVYGAVDANRLRIRTVSAIDGALAADPSTIQPSVGDEIFIFTLTVNKSRTVGTPSCVGCDAPVCLLLKHVLLTQSVGLGDFDYINPAVGSTGVISAQSPGLDCVGVPSKTKTWGQIKSLYR